MHIAFFNRSFHPDTSATGQILTDLCEDLVRTYGCRVTVVTGIPLMPAAADRTGDLPTREQYRGIDIRRVRGTTFSKRRFIGRAANYVSYFLSACWAGQTLEKTDVVVALTDPPIIGLAAWLAAKRHRAPLVMSYQDLFPEVAVLLSDFHSDTVNALLQSVNRFLCRHAARIVALGDTMKERLIENKGARRDRTVVIPSGADTRLIHPGPKRNAFSERHGLADRFVVMHSGNLGLSQSLETVVAAAALLREVPDIHIVFQGEGVLKTHLQERVSALQLANVTFLPFQPKEGLSESFAAADVFVVSLQAGLAGYIVPSKLYGILAAGRPYVAAVEETCEVAAITRRYECGLVVAPENARELADKILVFYRDRDLAARAGANARVAGLTFDRGLQGARYMEVFSAVTGEGRARIPSKIASTSPK